MSRSAVRPSRRGRGRRRGQTWRAAACSCRRRARAPALQTAVGGGGTAHGSLCGRPAGRAHTPDTFSRSRSEQKHTAAVSLSVTIHYPWHPLYGQTLPVRRQQVASGAERFIHVLLPDDTWCLVPGWMTSRERCAQLALSEQAEASVAALRELGRTLIELANAPEEVTIRSSISAKGKEERGDEKAVGRAAVDVVRRPP